MVLYSVGAVYSPSRRSVLSTTQPASHHSPCVSRLCVGLWCFNHPPLSVSSLRLTSRQSLLARPPPHHRSCPRRLSTRHRVSHHCSPIAASRVMRLRSGVYYPFKHPFLLHFGIPDRVWLRVRNGFGGELSGSADLKWCILTFTPAFLLGFLVRRLADQL